MDSSSFEHKRSLGQNFLTSDVVPKAMVAAANVTSSDVVLEIGPGTGMLTACLLKTGARVIALEADDRALPILQEAFEEEIRLEKLTLIHGDARNISVSELGLRDIPFKVVANIPYYLSGFLLRTLLESTHQPQSITFLIQKELAERIVRDPKSSLLSLSVRVFGTPQYIKTVSRGHFRPMPKVESAILHIHSISQHRFTTFTPTFFFTVLHYGFGSRRKQLQTNLAEHYPRELIQQHLSSLGLSESVRGEDMNLEQWCALAEKLYHPD